MNFGDAKYIVLSISITFVCGIRDNNNNNGLNILLLYLIIGVMCYYPLEHDTAMFDIAERY